MFSRLPEILAQAAPALEKQMRNVENAPASRKLQRENELRTTITLLEEYVDCSIVSLDVIALPWDRKTLFELEKLTSKAREFLLEPVITPPVREYFRKK